MSKMSELSQTLDALVVCGNNMTECGQELIRTANALRGMFSGGQEQTVAVKEEAPQPEPARVEDPAPEAKKLSFIDVRKCWLVIVVFLGKVVYLL